MENKYDQQYTCPMHPEVITDKPGNCPKCGMNLVPVKKSGEQDMPAKMNAGMDHSKMKMPALPSGGDDEPTGQPQNKKQYTCSMHPKVIKDEPGKCPYCGMVLIPLKTKDNAKGEHNKN